jgi:hypothetical protein
MSTRDFGSPPNHFHPEMPRIPGVNDGSAPHFAPRGLIWRLLLAAAGLAIAGSSAWWLLRAPRSAARASRPGSAVTLAAVAPPVLPVVPSHHGPEAIATVQELAKPWSSKKFTFYKPFDAVGVPAMIIRLPGVAGNRSDAYWAFSLNAPYELCQLDYVTSLDELASRFDYHATHPMVVSSCSGSVYDPLQIGTAPDGAWVRGEVMKGSGIRPPIAIEVRVHGRSIMADKIEQ